VLKILNSLKTHWLNEEMGKWTEQSFFKERSPIKHMLKTHEEMLNISGHKLNAN
jgi:hypothetical protein